MMDLREQIARAICGNWIKGDDRPWQVWLEEADAVLEVFRQATLTDTFVQPVPDRCDRIIWRGAYYHLPIAQAAVPEGWQLVPIEPTSAMTAAFNTAAEALRQSHLLSGSYPASWQPVEAGYRAMLKTAPKPEGK